MFKRLILVIVVCIIPIIANAGGEYPDYLYGDSNYPIIYAHMGEASYLDKSSVVIKEITPEQFVIAANTIGYNIDTKEQFPPHTIWFFYTKNQKKRGTTAFIDGNRTIILPPFVGNQIAYASHDNGDSWTPFYIDDIHGYNLSIRNAFLKTFKYALEQND